MGNSREVCFVHQKKLDFINNSIKEPESKIDPMYWAWHRCNDIIIAWIMKSLDPSVASHYLYATKAFEMWSKLKARYAMGSGLPKYQLNKNIATSLKGDESILKFYTRLKSFGMNVTT